MDPWFNITMKDETHKTLLISKLINRHLTATI